MRKGFDLFGVLFLSFVVAVVGGMMRDVLIGAVPPAAIARLALFRDRDRCRTADLLLLSGDRDAGSATILLFDALGLALFAVIGAQKAIEYGINP